MPNHFIQGLLFISPFKKKQEQKTGTRNNIVWNNVLNTSASLLGSCCSWTGTPAYHHAQLRKQGLFSPYFLSPWKFGEQQLSSYLRNLFIGLAINSWIISLYCLSFEIVVFYNTIHFAFAAPWLKRCFGSGLKDKKIPTYSHRMIRKHVTSQQGEQREQQLPVYLGHCHHTSRSG